MKLLARIKGFWTDRRLREMKEEHDREMQYTIAQYRRKIELVEGERDQAQKRLAALTVNLWNLCKMHGGGDV